MVTPEELATIEKIADRLSHKYVFGFFSEEDIRQEAIIIGLEAVQNRWDRIRPLENFLSIHIGNRLKNFKRNNYFRRDVEESNTKRSITNNNKKSLMEPSELGDVCQREECNFVKDIQKSEIINNLLDKMPQEIKADFYRLANNVAISKNRKNKVIDFVKENINEDW